MCKLHNCQGEIFYMHKEIGKRVQQVREYFNLTRKQFIQIIKVDLSTVSRIETGKQPPSEVFLDALMARFLVNPIWVKTGDGEMFISAKEYVLNGINLLGMKQLGEGLIEILKDPQFAELKSTFSIREIVKDKLDPNLEIYFQSILDRWQQGDENIRGWLKVELEGVLKDKSR